MHPIKTSCKLIEVAFPLGHHTSELKRHASSYLTVGEDNLRASQLPEQIVKPNGFVLQRPEHWK